MSLDNLLQAAQDRATKLEDELSDITGVILNYGWGEEKLGQSIKDFLEEKLEQGVKYQTMLQEIQEVMDVGI